MKPQKTKTKPSPYRVGSDIMALGIIKTERSRSIWQRTIRKIQRWNTFS